jgi:hypothetical protein
MTTAHDLVDLQRRVHALERRMRAYRLGALLALAAFAALACQAAPPQAAETLRLRRLEILDDQGIARLVLGQDPKDTQRRSRACALTVHDSTGAERGGIATFDDLSVVIALDAPHGVGAPMRDRLGLKVDPDGSACIGLIDNKTLMPVRLQTDAQGGGGLEFLSYDLDKKVATIKRIGFAGESKREEKLDEQR